MQAGTHTATKVLAAYLGESPEKKTPYFEIEFELKDGTSIGWVAWLSTASENAIAAANRHIQTLKKLGYKRDKLSDMADEKLGIEDLFGQPEDEIKLVIEMETYEAGGETKERAIVKFVNIGYDSGLTKFDHKQAVTKFKSLPFDGTLKKLKAGEKLPPAPKKDKSEDKTPPAGSENTAGAGADFGADDIPF